MDDQTRDTSAAHASSAAHTSKRNASARWMIALSAVSALSIGLWWSSTAQGQAGGAPQGGGLQNGRFRLFQGEYLVRENPNNNSSKEIDSRGFFKLDTATGRAWRYNANVGPAGKWEEVHN